MPVILTGQCALGASWQAPGHGSHTGRVSRELAC